jgi:hypothetical protein
MSRWHDSVNELIWDEHETYLPWATVASAQISELAWVTTDGSTQLGLNPDPINDECPHLFVHFKGNPPSLYVYRAVPKGVYEAVLTDESIGRAFHAKVKSQSYEFAKLGTTE